MKKSENRLAPEEELNQLMIELFRMFARFEFALKASGFNNGEGTAEANWGAFAVSIEKDLQNQNSKEVKEAINYLLTKPPKKQVIKNGSLTWSTAKPNTNSQADLLLLYVRRVRNNLFHGGKFNGRWFAPERSERLLRHSLVILRACLDVSRPVAEAYNS